MIGRMTNDRGISTIATSAFNYDGVERNELDLDEARDILNYDVIVKPCHTDSGEPIDALNYIVNSRDGHIIPSAGVGDRFCPYPNVNMFDTITKDIIPNIPGLRLETVATIHGMGVGIITTTFGDDFKIPGDKSPNKFRLLFSNDNTGKTALLFGLTSVRVVCMNTLAMASSEVKRDGFKVRHTETAESKVSEAVKTVYARLQQISFFKNRITNLATTQVSDATVNKVLNRIYPLDGYPTDMEIVSRGRSYFENLRGEVISNFEGDDSFTSKSAWNLFNAFTKPIFQEKASRKNTDRTEMTYRASISDTAAKINRWLNIVEQEANIRNVA